MKILALDLSSTCTGVAVVEDGYLDISSVESLPLPQKMVLGQKLVVLDKAFKKLFKKYNPDFIVLENIFKGPSAITFKTLSMLRGVVFKLIYETYEKEPISIMPTEARKMAGVVGVKKEDAFAFVVKKYSFNKFVFEKDNDKTDAIVLALAGYNFVMAGQPQRQKKKKKKKVKK